MSMPLIKYCFVYQALTKQHKMKC